ncbi:MAG: PaaI family thioesterase, partial [Chloroflexales bacterium]|nr:PaaI family thioesterase [Chloroflexales bacterium]
AATPAEYHYNPIGSVHGGVAATLCDSAMACAIHTTLPAGVGYTTLELKVNFVRPITVQTGRVTCEGTLIHMGGRVATAEARLTDASGALYAHATTTCLVLRPTSNEEKR